MGRLASLLVLAGLLYVGYTQALPWIEARLETLDRGAETRGASAEDDQARRCVRLAQQANDTFADLMRQFSRPPIDRQQWTGAFLAISGEVGSAQTACACAEDACGPAAEAMSELRELTLSFDGIARGTARGTSNPASRQARVEELLTEARRLAGG